MDGADQFRGGWPDEEELGRLAYSSPDPLMMLDADGVILAVNPAWWDVLGWEPDSKLEATRWIREEVYIPGLAEVDHTACYRAMDWLPDHRKRCRRRCSSPSLSC